MIELSDDWALRPLKVATHDIEQASQFTRNLVDHLLLRADMSTIAKVGEPI